MASNASNEVLALDANFNSWKAKRFPSSSKGDNPFEYYCIEQFARAFDLGDSQLKAGMVGKGGDGGIDAFYIFANGDMVDAETELIPKETPEFRLLIMQDLAKELGVFDAGCIHAPSIAKCYFAASPYYGMRRNAGCLGFEDGSAQRRERSGDY